MIEAKIADETYAVTTAGFSVATWNVNSIAAHERQVLGMHTAILDVVNTSEGRGTQANL